MRHKIIVLLVLLTFSIVSVNGQNNSREYRITGFVTDKESRNALEYATVALMDLDSTIIAGGITDNQGKYILKAPAGEYILKIQFISYKAQKLPVSLSRSTGDIKLDPISLAPDSEILSEVVISEERDIMEMQLDKRVFNVGENAANLGANASDILDNIPSVQVDIEGNISLRGSENVNVLIDGKPSSLIGLNSSTALRQIQGSMIESIEVVTNPSARYQAEGSAGIINIVLKKNEKKGINGSVDVGTGFPTNYNAGINLNYRFNKINFFTNYGIRYNLNPGGGYSNDQYFLNSPSELNFTERTRDHERGGLSHNIRFGADYFINETNTLTGSFLYRVSDEKNVTDNIYRDYDLYRNPLATIYRTDTETEDDHNQEYSLNYKKKFKRKGHELTAFLQYRSNFETEASDIIEENYEIASTINQKFDNAEGEENYLLQIDYIHPIGKESKIETGYRGTLRNTENDYAVQELQNDIWITFDSLSNNFEYNEEIHAIYGIYSRKMDKVSYQLGLRSEYTDIQTHLHDTGEKNNKNYINFFPSLHFSYKLLEGTDLQISYSRRLHRPRFRHLNPFSNYSDARNLRTGNPDLNPEFTDSFEFGFLRNWKTGSLLSSAYYNYTTGVVQRVRFTDPSGVSRSTPYNLGSRNSFGLEFTASQDITKWWSMNANFNFFRSIVEGQAEGQILSADTYSWNSRINSKINFWKDANFQMNFNYRGPQLRPQGERKAMYNLDIGLSKDVLKGKGTVTISGRDIFNTRKYRGITNNEGMYSESEFQWRSRQFLIGLNYRINKKKDRRGGDRDGRDGGGFDDDGGI